MSQVTKSYVMYTQLSYGGGTHKFLHTEHWPDKSQRPSYEPPPRTLLCDLASLGHGASAAKHSQLVHLVTTHGRLPVTKAQVAT